jgi:hypothetical protein
MRAALPIHNAGSAQDWRNCLQLSHSISLLGCGLQHTSHIDACHRKASQVTSQCVLQHQPAQAFDIEAVDEDAEGPVIEMVRIACCMHEWPDAGDCSLDVQHCAARVA